jgi:hypothetical protein
MSGACSTYWGEKRCIHGFGGKPEAKRPLGKSRCRWEDNIKMDIHEVVCGSMVCIDVAQDTDRWRALVIAVMNLRAV